MANEASAEISQPLSKFAFVIAGAAQSVFAAGGVSVSLPISALWALAVACLITETVRPKWSCLKKFIAIAVISGVMIAPIIWYFRPGIAFEVGNDGPFWATDKSNNKWLRFAVTNTGPRDAVCRSWLKDFQKDGGQLVSINTMLYAANFGDPDVQQGFYMPSGAKRMFNLIMIEPSPVEMKIASPEYNNTVHPALTPGNYSFNVEVDGKDCGPASTTIRLRYGGGSSVTVLN